MMSLVEVMILDYGQTLRSALWELPLTAAFAILGARHARLGIDRPGFGDMAADAAREKAKAYFQANYQIV
jgi:hypothetical protein